MLDGIALLQERMVGGSRLPSTKESDGIMNRRFYRHTLKVTRHSNILTERKQNHKLLDPLMGSTTGLDVILKYTGKAASHSSSENSSRRMVLQTLSCSGRREYTKGSRPPNTCVNEQSSVKDIADFASSSEMIDVVSNDDSVGNGTS
jgi:hypothetical protein